MNSLRVDGFFVWSSYGTGMGGRSVCVKRAVTAIIWARMSSVSGWLVGASHEAFPIAYIIPCTPSSACIFLSPRFTARHTCMNMETVKGFLSPLGLNTSSIQDTLVCILRSFPRWVRVFSCIYRNWLSLAAQSRLLEGPRYPHGMDLWIVRTSFWGDMAG
jgi:hypothetical protein